MSVEEEQVQAPSPEECTTDNTPHVMPTESHESPAILSPIGCGIFQGSASSHLGLSGFGNSSDNAAEEMSKCHASLFEDDQNFAFGGFDLNIDAVCAALASEEQQPPNKDTQLKEKIENDTVSEHGNVDETHHKPCDSVGEKPGDPATMKVVDKEVEVSPTRRVQFKKDLEQIHIFYPDDASVSQEGTSNKARSPDMCRAPIKPILKRRRDKTKESDLPAKFRLSITQPKCLTSTGDLTPERSVPNVPVYNIGEMTSCHTSMFVQEKYLLKSLLDLDCSVQMMRNRNDVLLARVQRAVQRLNKT